MTKEGDNLNSGGAPAHKLESIAGELLTENADLKVRLHESRRELELLYSLVRKTAIAMDWNEVQEMPLDVIVEFFPVARFCLIAVFDEEHDRLVVRMRTSRAETTQLHHVPMTFDIDHSTTWDEVVASDEWNNFASQIHYLRELQSSFIPLGIQNKQIGFLMLAKNKDDEYTQDEWRFLSTIAHYFSVTLENSQLYNLAITDPLTGLFNRRYFDNRLEREIEKAQRRNMPLTLLMLDLDHFKNVNDTHGHPAGDDVLRETAARITEAAGETSVCCRYGGEEFTVLLPDTERKTASAVAERIRELMSSKLFDLDTPDVKAKVGLTISGGLASFPFDAAEPEALVERADQALYLAKAQGRDRIV